MTTKARLPSPNHLRTSRSAQRYPIFPAMLLTSTEVSPTAEDNELWSAFQVKK